MAENLPPTTHNRGEWNKRVIEAGGSFLQSWEWGEFQKKRGRKIYRLENEEMLASVILIPLPFGKSYSYIPHGPIIKSHKDINVPETLNSLLASVLKENPQCIFLRMDPQWNNTVEWQKELNNRHFIQIDSAQPASTILINLKEPREVLFKKIESDTRYAIRTAEKRGVVTHIYSGEEKKKYFDDFWKLFEATNRRHGLRMYPKTYYEGLASFEEGCPTELITGEYEGEIISIALIIHFGNYSAYLYAASAEGCGKLNAPSAVLWRSIIRAQEHGSKIFDLWGASKKIKKWKGITDFKRSFGGEEVNYIGTWDYPYQKLWYWLYQIGKKLR